MQHAAMHSRPTRSSGRADAPLPACRAAAGRGAGRVTALARSALRSRARSCRRASGVSYSRDPSGAPCSSTRGVHHHASVHDLQRIPIHAPWRRAADPLAGHVVHRAVTRAFEAPRRLAERHGAAEMRTLLRDGEQLILRARDEEPTGAHEGRRALPGTPPASSSGSAPPPPTSPAVAALHRRSSRRPRRAGRRPLSTPLRAGHVVSVLMEHRSSRFEVQVFPRQHEAPSRDRGKARRSP